MTTSDPPTRASAGVGRPAWPIELPALLAGIASDIHATYRDLRRHGPVVALPIGHLVLGYDAAGALLREPGMRKHTEAGVGVADEIRRRVLAELDLPVETGEPPPDVAAVLDASVVSGESEDHARIRGAIVSIIASWRREELVEITDDLATRLRRQLLRTGRADLVTDFARPLATGITCELLGIDQAHAESMEEMSRTVTRLIDPFVAQSDPAVVAAVRRLCEITAGLVAEPERDSTLAAAARQARLSPAELSGMLLVLMVAGHQTILHTLSNLAVMIDRQPGHVRSQEPRQIWDEVLRLEPPVQTLGRVTASAVEVGGTVIPGDAVVLVSLGAANRDPDRFADPDSFLPGRPAAGRHLSFGAGERACVGARMAGVLAPGLVTAVLDVLDEVTVIRGRIRPLSSLNLRGFSAIPVTGRSRPPAATLSTSAEDR